MMAVKLAILHRAPSELQEQLLKGMEGRIDVKISSAHFISLEPEESAGCTGVAVAF